MSPEKEKPILLALRAHHKHKLEARQVMAKVKEVLRSFTGLEITIVEQYVEDCNGIPAGKYEAIVTRAYIKRNDDGYIKGKREGDYIVLRFVFCDPQISINP
jgi:hypothetical protein